METREVDIGPNVRKYRTERGWSQRQLAERAGLTGQTVWLIEQGGSNPELKTLLKLTSALGVEIASLIEG